MPVSKEDTGTLIVDEYLGYYVLVWIVDGDYGAYVGEYVASIETKPTTANDEWDYLLAEWVAARDPFRCPETLDFRYIWYTSKDAKACLRRIKAEWDSARAATPWPEWALLAQAAGWKPPKGWKP